MKRSLFITYVAVAMLLSSYTHVAAQSADVLYIDQMDNLSRNKIGGRNAVYQQSPSIAAIAKHSKWGREANNYALKIRYTKENEGGPRDDGGFCGFYSIVKTGSNGYLDASSYKYLTFWVKGKTGTEKFKVGVSDPMWEALDDSFQSQEVGNYLPAGKITTSWQIVTIPVEEFFIEWDSLHAIYIRFDADAFEDGAGSGTVFIDDIALRKTLP